MKSYSLLMKVSICCGFVLMHSPSYTQGRATTVTQGRVLSAVQLDAIVKTDIASCSTPSGQTLSGQTNPATIIPTRNARAIPKDRIAKTLNGIWRGRVIGDDGDVGVDYYWITDVKRDEALVIAQRSGKQTVAEPRQVATAPKLTFLMCAHEGYEPSKGTPQVHEFVKVSDNLRNAPRILQESTGLKLSKKRPTLSDLWRGLVAMRYFSDPRFADEHGNAYAGGFLKPFEIQPVASAIGPATVSLTWNGEYRGGGATSLKFTPGVPVYGVEHAQFVGTTTNSGDFLVSSPGNGKLWKVEAIRGAEYDLAFDKVTIGPLQ